MSTVLREHFEYITPSQYSIFGHLIRLCVQSVHSDEYTNDQINLIQAFIPLLKNYQCGAHLPTLSFEHVRVCILLVLLFLFSV